MRQRWREMVRLIFHNPTMSLEEVDYDTYWRSRRKEGASALNRFGEYRADWIIGRIENGAAVLDIGCGDGSILRHIRERKNIRAIAVENSDVVIGCLKDQGFDAQKLDFEDFESVESLPEADHILLLEVIEHMKNPEKFLRIIETKARRSIIFSVPNSGYFPYRIRLLSGRFPMQWRVHPGEHLRYWTLADMRRWLRDLGYLEFSTLHCYEGIPLLNRVWGSMFSMGIIVEIDLEKSRS